MAAELLVGPVELAAVAAEVAPARVAELQASVARALLDQLALAVGRPLHLPRLDLVLIDYSVLVP